MPWLQLHRVSVTRAPNDLQEVQTFDNVHWTGCSCLALNTSDYVRKFVEIDQKNLASGCYCEHHDMYVVFTCYVLP